MCGVIVVLKIVGDLSGLFLCCSVVEYHYGLGRTGCYWVYGSSYQKKNYIVIEYEYENINKNVQHNKFLLLNDKHIWISTVS